MTTLKTKLALGELAASAKTPSKDTPDVTPGEASSLRRSNQEWDEKMLDYAAIEKRAQEMRSEAAWAIINSVRGWTMNLFRQGKAKAQAAAQAPLESHAQSS